MESVDWPEAADAPAIPSNTPNFPTDLIGAKVLLATESYGPVNGVSRTTQSLVDYLRYHGVNVAVCAPQYKGAALDSVEQKAERTPLINHAWVRSIEAKSSSLAKRGIGGAWQWHNERHSQASAPQSGLPGARKPLLTRSRSDSTERRLQSLNTARLNPKFRLGGSPLPYNPDLTVAFPFRLNIVYNKTFIPDIIYLASPASVGFQFLIQLGQLHSPPPTLLNFQTDLSAYSGILFRPPLDRYAKFLLQMVQGYLFRMSNVHTIFYPCGAVRQYLESARAPACKMKQLGRGVDVELFNPSLRDDSYRRFIAPNNEIIFGCVSRLAPEKGFEFLARIAHRLLDCGLDFRLLIVGGNKNPVVEDEVRGYFEDLSDKVIFTGFLRGKSLARAYASIDIFLHCSITETFGLVVLESMASGVPVIARNEGGPSEIVKHGTSGFLTDSHNLDAFVKYAVQLATDDILRSRLAQHARAQAIDTTWDKINNQVAEQLAVALRHQTLDREAGDEELDHYSTWSDFVRIHLAVGVVWIFWFIAVLPLLICGRLHGLFKMGG